jgi:hypothetical protein
MVLLAVAGIVLTLRRKRPASAAVCMPRIKTIKTIENRMTLPFLTVILAGLFRVNSELAFPLCFKSSVNTLFTEV